MRTLWLALAWAALFMAQLAYADIPVPGGGYNVTEGTPGTPSAVYDFKFTIDPNVVLSQSRINNIRFNAGLSGSVPITVVHP